MSTIVCQNHMFESQILTESTTTLKLKVCNNQEINHHHHPTNIEFGNWGFLQTAPKESSWADYNTDNWAKKSSFSRFGPKSLELCTENLGSETGTDILTDSSTNIFSSTSSFIHYPPSDKTEKTMKSPQNPNNNHKEKKNFPPPLTSSLQVRHHREGGRLIIEAVEAPFRNSYLQAERSDGRLRLSFLTAAEETTSSAAAAGGDEEEEEEEIAAAVEEEEVESEDEVEINKKNINNKNNNNNNNNLEIMEREKFQRVSRYCKEGGHIGNNKGLCSNWKPALWVATS